MKRKISITVIILAVYFAIFISIYVILPLFFHNFRTFGGYFPLFFFFPFIFGRRGMRRRNTAGGNTGHNGMPTPEDEVMNGHFDTDAWEKRNADRYDEFGIKTTRATSRYLYYAGVAIIMVAVFFLLYFRGFLF